MPQMPTAIAYGVTCRPPDSEEVLVLFLADVDATAAAANQHAGAGLPCPQAGVAPRLSCRR